MSKDVCARLLVSLPNLSSVHRAFTLHLTLVSTASSQLPFTVDRILISCFADYEVIVNKHGHWMPRLHE